MAAIGFKTSNEPQNDSGLGYKKKKNQWKAEMFAYF